MGGVGPLNNVLEFFPYVLNLGNRFSKNVVGSSQDPPTVLLDRTEELDVSNTLVLPAGLSGGLNGN